MRVDILIVPYILCKDTSFSSPMKLILDHLLFFSRWNSFTFSLASSRSQSILLVATNTTLCAYQAIFETNKNATQQWPKH